MHIHILGICGTFMGGLAALAREAGHKVTGCDTGVYPPMSDQLRGLGIELIEGYGADQMAFEPDVFVVGNVISRARLADGTPKYPLMEAILEQRQTLHQRPAMAVGPRPAPPHPPATGPRHVLAVAGTHGKTTTTAMLAWILEHAGLQPGFLVGGVPLNFGVSARLGEGNTFVIEADEYDTAFFDKRSKFVHYRPRTAVLNNLEFDHADIFDDLAAIERQFHHLVRTVPSQGRVVVNAAEASLQRVLAQGCWSEQLLFGNGLLNKAGFTAHGDRMTSRAQGRRGCGPCAVGHQRRAQPAQRAGRDRGGRARGRGARGRGPCAGGLPERQAPHGSARRDPAQGRRHHGVRRLRPPPDRHPHHGGRPAPPAAKRRPGCRAHPRHLRAAQQHHEAGRHDGPAALEPGAGRPGVLPCGGLDWDARAALAPMGERAQVAGTIDQLLEQVKAAARPGDHLLCMSNGGFGGIHAKLLEALKA
jgi:UDP-N-acetylmuramate: L-alanyl-gamma-D-glutamyl-meso-diaminopimelate ligase